MVDLFYSKYFPAEFSVEHARFKCADSAYLGHGSFEVVYKAELPGTYPAVSVSAITRFFEMFPQFHILSVQLRSTFANFEGSIHTMHLKVTFIHKELTRENFVA